MEAVPKKPSIKKPAAHVRKPRVVKPHAEPEVAKPEEVTALVPKPAVAKIPHGKHFYAVGRRKTSVAQVLLTAGNGEMKINQLAFENYFSTADLQQIVKHPLVSLGLEKQINVKAKVQGGGIHSQAESMRHAISRALVAHNPESRRTLKKLGFLTRDPRVKERKKPGLKRARRAPQFSKR
jgi:small subunit ribosomal protein S9